MDPISKSNNWRKDFNLAAQSPLRHAASRHIIPRRGPSHTMPTVRIACLAPVTLIPFSSPLLSSAQKLRTGLGQAHRPPLTQAQSASQCQLLDSARQCQLLASASSSTAPASGSSSTAPASARSAPVQELTESTPEPVPVQEITESTPEPAPVQSAPKCPRLQSAP